MTIHYAYPPVFKLSLIDEDGNRHDLTDSIKNVDRTHTESDTIRALPDLSAWTLSLSVWVNPIDAVCLSPPRNDPGSS